MNRFKHLTQVEAGDAKRFRLIPPRRFTSEREGGEAMSILKLIATIAGCKQSARKEEVTVGKIISISVRAALLFVVLLLMGIQLGYADQAVLPEQARPLTPGELRDEVAKEATFMFDADYRSTVTVRQPLLVQDQLAQLKAEILNLVRNGQLSPEDLVPAVLKAMLQKPETYLVQTAFEDTFDAEAAFTCTGFFITPDGYAVTAAHCVVINQEVREDLIKAGIQTFINQQDVLLTLQGLFGANLSPADVKQLNALYEQYFLKNATLGPITSNYDAELGKAVPGVIVGPLVVSAMVVGSPGQPSYADDESGRWGGKDVAVLKLEGEESDFPTLPLGDESSLRSGDSLEVVGYPGLGTYTGSSESEQERKVIPGTISGTSPNSENWSYLAFSGNITNGDSGGPAITATGQVVGIAAFGTYNPETKQVVQNYLVPVSIVKEFIPGQAHLAESQFTKMYTQALEIYSQGDFKKALSVLEELNNISPGNPRVQYYITWSQIAILALAGQRAGWATWAYVLLAAGAVLFLLLVGALVFLGLQGRLNLRRLFHGSRPFLMMLLALGLALSLAVSTWAAVGDHCKVTTTAGVVYQGTIIEETDTEISLLLDQGLQTIKIGKSEIAKIECQGQGEPPPPVADFSASTTSGTAPLTVQFTNKSSGEITSYSWDFGDGGSDSSQNPSHTYQSPDNYTVKLTVTGPGGSDTKTLSGYINVSALPPPSPPPSPPTPPKPTTNQGLGLTLGVLGPQLPGWYVTKQLGDLALGLGSMHDINNGETIREDIPLDLKNAQLMFNNGAVVTIKHVYTFAMDMKPSINVYYGLVGLPQNLVTPSLLVGWLDASASGTGTQADEMCDRAGNCEQGQAKLAVQGEGQELIVGGLVEVPLYGHLRASLSAWLGLNSEEQVSASFQDCYPSLGCSGFEVRKLVVGPNTLSSVLAYGWEIGVGWRF